MVKTRRPNDETNARLASSIVRRCLETGQALLSDDAQRDDRMQLSQSVVDFRIRSVMCVPLCAGQGKPFGVIQLDTQDRSKKFTQEDLKLLWGVANQAAIAMENARLLRGSGRARTVASRDWSWPARAAQLPAEPLPEVAGYEFLPITSRPRRSAATITASSRCRGRLAVAVGDVAGKGMPAALLMAKLSSETRFCLPPRPTAAAVTKLNDLLYEFTSDADRFVTLALLVLDPARHTVTLVSAGHPSPLLYRAGSALEEVISKDGHRLAPGHHGKLPLRGLPARAAAGQSLLIFTDGVTDMLDPQGVPVHHRGTRSSCRAEGQTSVQQLVDRIARAIQSHAAGTDPFDDVTLVGVGRAL